MEKGAGHKIIGMVSMDLSKAFDTQPHDLIVSKLRAYGADDGTVDLIRDYLTDRQQRVKIGEVCSSWESICRGIPQGSVVLSRIKKMLPLQIRKQLYQSFIVPHFNYCSESWHFCGKRLSDKLEKLNERALRFVYRDYSTPYETLLIKNGHTTLVNQRLGKMMGTVFRAVNKTTYQPQFPSY